MAGIDKLPNKLFNNFVLYIGNYNGNFIKASLFCWNTSKIGSLSLYQVARKDQINNL